MELLLQALLSYLLSLAANERTSAMHKAREEELKKTLDDVASLRAALMSYRSFGDEIDVAIANVARNRARLGISPQEEPLWELLLDDIFRADLTSWLMAGGIEEGAAVRVSLVQRMEKALQKTATIEQAAFLRDQYFEIIEREVFSNHILAHWRHQLSLNYLRQQVAVLRKHTEELAGIYSHETRQSSLEHYCEVALKAWDIIDLSNLPESDVHISTQTLLLRQLYVPLCIKVESHDGSKGAAVALNTLEKRREQRRLREAGRLGPEVHYESFHGNGDKMLYHVGERLSGARRLVVLGDPGSGKTTLLRWMATAYLLRYRNDPLLNQLPGTSTLPENSWIPVLIRCRDLGEADLCRSFNDFVDQHFSKSELKPEDASIMKAVVLERMATGGALLLVDGVDEITNPSVRILFCQELERTAARYPEAHIVVTSRLVGYRDMPYRISAGFEHGVIEELSKEDKDLFARRWIEVTEQHLSSGERKQRSLELVEALHSSDRIERITGNPMLLTTLALVKRKVGKLPSRRNKLYAEAVSVLLNWNPRIHQTIDEEEAIPQLQYIAYEMCRRGVQRLSQDDILDLLDRVREEYKNVRAIRNHDAKTFLDLLETRSSILIRSGGLWMKHKSGEKPVWEFRHLTFQEYLAARALLDRRYPDRDKYQSLAQHIAPLAGLVIKSNFRCQGQRELQVSDSWREALRLCVSGCSDDDIDDVLLAILKPLYSEDAATTARPRAILAALCLTDDPNISEEMAIRVLGAFANQILPGDSYRNAATSLNYALREIGASRWASALISIFIERLKIEEISNWKSLCVLGGRAAAAQAPRERKALSAWVTRQVLQLQHSDGVAVCAVALAIAELAARRRIAGTPILIERLMSILNNGHPTTITAARALYWLNKPQLGRRAWRPSQSQKDRLLEFLRQPLMSLGSLYYICLILGREQVKEAVVHIAELANSPNDDIRGVVARSLGEIGDPQATDLLLQYLQDKDVDVQVAAVRALGDIKDPRSVDSLLACVSNTAPKVRRAAIRSLGEIADPRATDLLLKCLHDEDVEVQDAAAYALGDIKDPRSVDFLLVCLGDNETRLQILAAQALGNIKTPQAVTALIAALSSAKGDARAWILLALCKNEDSRCLDILMACLKDTDIGVQNIATNLLHGYARGCAMDGSFRMAADIFAAMHSVRPDADTKNNLAYSLIVLQQFDKAVEIYKDLDCTEESELWVLTQHNKGVLAALMGKDEVAREHLLNALQWTKEEFVFFDPNEVLCMVLLDGHGHVTSHNNMPIDAAIMINLYRIGSLSLDELHKRLMDAYPENYMTIITNASIST